MKFWENRKLSCILMITIILLSTLLGSRRSLMKLRNETIDIFYEGVTLEDGTKEKGIQEDLNDIVSRCSTLVGIAKKYIQSDEMYLADEVSELSLSLTETEDIQKKYQILTKLESSVNQLYYALEDENMSTNNKNSAMIVMYDISSFIEITGHNEYNQYAQKFNQQLNTFPASLLSKCTFVKEVPTFR